MTPLDELLQHLRFERQHRSAKTRPVPLLRKLLLAPIHGTMLSLFNFGSSFARDASPVEAVPTQPRPLPLLEIAPGEWPHRNGVTTGLPLSDSVASRVVFHDFGWVDDASVAMRELHRVAAPGATISVPELGANVDPLQRRPSSAEALRFFTSDSPRAQPFAAMFRAANDGTLQVVTPAATAPPPHSIDLGCGTNKAPGHFGIDIAPLPGVDLVRDVDRLGLPFSDDTIAHVHASHFLEHVIDVVALMNEIHRVCCDGAIVEIVVPTLLGPWAAADPTHRRLFNARSFEYFTDVIGEGGYGGVRGTFELLSQHVSSSMRVRLRVRKRRTP